MGMSDEMNLTKVQYLYATKFAVCTFQTFAFEMLGPQSIDSWGSFGRWLLDYNLSGVLLFGILCGLAWHVEKRPSLLIELGLIVLSSAILLAPMFDASRTDVMWVAIANFLACYTIRNHDKNDEKRNVNAEPEGDDAELPD